MFNQGLEQYATNAPTPTTLRTVREQIRDRRVEAEAQLKSLVELEAVFERSPDLELALNLLRQIGF